MNLRSFFKAKMRGTPIKIDNKSLPNHPPRHVVRHQERYRLIPALRDTDNLPLEWHPYIMRRAKPNYSTATVNTDAFGFRRCGFGHELIDFEHVIAHGGPVGLLSGNSTSFGIGVSSDTATIPSLLNRICAGSGMLWYNASHRASNLTQERINLDLYAPRNTTHVVFLSGGNNLIVTLLKEGGSQACCPFVGEPRFMALNTTNIPMPGATLEERYRLMMASTARDLELLGQKGKYLNWKILFLLQPFAAWCKRVNSSEEKELIEIWDEHPSVLHQVHTPANLNPWKSRFVEDVGTLCERNGLDFVDLNTNSVFLEGRWLFADRVHLTDEGHRRIAEITVQWLKKTNHIL